MKTTIGQLKRLIREVSYEEEHWTSIAQRPRHGKGFRSNFRNAVLAAAQKYYGVPDATAEDLDEYAKVYGFPQASMSYNIVNEHALYFATWYKKNKGIE
jgi:hypothetical protein